MAFGYQHFMATTVNTTMLNLDVEVKLQANAIFGGTLYLNEQAQSESSDFTVACPASKL